MALAHTLVLSALALAASCQRHVPAVSLDNTRCDPLAVASPVAVTSLHDTPGQLRFIGGGLHPSPDDGRGFNLTGVYNREDTPRRVVLSLTQVGAMQFANCSMAAVLADARRVAGTPHVSASPGPDGTHLFDERFEVSIDPSAAAALATSRCVVFDVCGVVFPLQARQVEGLRGFIEQVRRE